MATELAKAYVQIVPSAKGIKGSITNVLNQEATTAGDTAGSTIGTKLSNGIKTAVKSGAIAAGAILTGTLAAAIKEGAALQQSLGGIVTMFGDSAQKMKDYANQAYATAGLSANTYMEQATSFSAALLQSLDGDTEAAAESANQAIIDMSDNANKFGTDIARIQDAYQGFAKQNYTMLDNLKLGYGGTKSEMERLLADAEAISGQEYDISNLNDVYEAIHLIQEETGITGTTADEAAKTFSGSFASMKASAQNLLGNIALGEDVSDELNTLMGTIVTFAGNAVPMVTSVLQSLPTLVSTLLSSGLISEVLPNLAGTIGVVVPQLVASITENLPALLQAGIDIIVALVNGISTSIPQLIGMMPDIVSQMNGSIIGNLPLIISAGINLLIALIGGMAQAFPSLVAMAPKIFTTVKSTLASMDWAQIGSQLISVLLNSIRHIVAKVAQTFNNVKTAILKPINNARDAVRKVVNTIKGMFSFKVSLPNIKLPHFSITPSGWKLGDLLQGSIPKLGIKWYAQGGIFSSPTIAGIGEAGNEAVVPLDRLWLHLDDIAESAQSSGGDYNQTINVYAPTALSASEVARQTRNSTRNMVLAMRR